ncbi:hypothetical protein [Catenibacterium sp. RTP21428st1_D7_RTP21428_210409]|uniref:hypothetical protein n=1 Tax=Catenibacterium sp. RTP21428st1_D7_RTP21428_210409 TaxID=3153688 RepID=UPI0032ED0B4F
MTAKKGLDAISKRTLELWYKVNEKYGEHVYTLGVNGNDKVVLSKGYGKTIELGTTEVNKALKELLKTKGGQKCETKINQNV